MKRALLTAIWLLSSTLGLGKPIWETDFPTGLSLGTESKLERTSFEGKWTLVYFGFTSCRYVCPTALKSLVKLRSRLGNAKGKPLQIFFVTVDPSKDSSEQLESYLSSTAPEIHGISGEVSKLSQLSFILSGRPLPQAPDKHAGTVYLISPRGEMVEKYSLALSGRQLASEIEKHFDEVGRD